MTDVDLRLTFSLFIVGWIEHLSTGFQTLLISVAIWCAVSKCRTLHCLDHTTHCHTTSPVDWYWCLRQVTHRLEIKLHKSDSQSRYVCVFCAG